MLKSGKTRKRAVSKASKKVTATVSEGEVLPISNKTKMDCVGLPLKKPKISDKTPEASSKDPSFEVEPDRGSTVENQFLTTFTEEELCDATQQSLEQDRNDGNNGGTVGKQSPFHEDDVDDSNVEFVTKKDFQMLTGKFNQLLGEFQRFSRHVHTSHSAMLQKLDALSQSDREESQSLISPTSRSEGSLAKRQHIHSDAETNEVVYCSVMHQGKKEDLKLHRATITRLEAMKSKRGICIEVLQQLHPELSFFRNRTVSGKSNRKADNLEPLPSLTVKFCIEVVNMLLPLPRKLYSTDEVYSEQLIKHEQDTKTQIGRAIIVIRDKNKKLEDKPSTVVAHKEVQETIIPAAMDGTPVSATPIYKPSLVIVGSGNDDQ